MESESDLMSALFKEMLISVHSTYVSIKMYCVI